MKLVFLIDNTRKIGGGSYSQFVFAKTLASKGHQVVIFAGDRNFYSPVLQNSQLKVFYRPSIPLYFKKVGIGRLNKIWRMLYLQFFISPFLKRYKPDWLIGHLRYAAIDARQLGKRLNIKTANFVYETPVWVQEQMNKSLNSYLSELWKEAKSAYEHTDVLIPNSVITGKKMKEWIPQANVSKPVYPGVATLPVINRSEGIDVIYLGRLKRHKNVDELLMACDPKHRVAIVGAGELEKDLQILAKKLSLNATFYGSVSDERKWELLQMSKLMVFPSSFEGFGVPPLEALACGCQVLCSDIPILREIYGHQVAYFNLHDVEAMRSKIEELLSSNEKPSSDLVKKYTWVNAAMDIEEILSNSQEQSLS